MKIDSLFIHLPERVSKALISLKETEITEIRLRANGPVSVTCKKGNVTFDSFGKVTPPEKALILTEEEISACVDSLCKHSRYSFEEYIKNGFIPLERGARAGICGNAITEDGKIISFSHITSINVRLNIFLPEIAKDTALLMKKSPFGVLVYSPPCRGKTTYLKSLIYLLSTGKYTPPYRVGVIDERFELGDEHIKKGLCDIISGVSKNVAIELFTRTLSPEIIVCDEVTATDEEAILNGCNAGVCFICSFHGKSIEEISKRSFVKRILNAGIFQYSVGIEKTENEYKYTIMKL